MPAFHGDRYDEVPEDFIAYFLQSMGTTDDDYKTRSFIYYLEVDSVADEWYEELPEEGKRNWEAIEASFYKRWPRKQEISIKEKAILEYDAPITHQSTPTSSEPLSSPYLDPHHEIDTKNNTRDTQKDDVERNEPQDVTATSPTTTTTSLDSLTPQITENNAKFIVEVTNPPPARTHEP
jgi:hypothetical protein